MRLSIAFLLLTCPLLAQSDQASLFVPITPCRAVDTRLANGPLGGPSLAGGAQRDFPIASTCNVPPVTIIAYSVNVTVAPAGPLRYLTVWPAGSPRPVVSTLNSFDGRIVANAAIVPASGDGSISVFATEKTDVIIDVNGYFFSGPTTHFVLPGNAFFPVTPCRAVDTRLAAGPLGGPIIGEGQSREFVLASVCGLPSNATAYSLNITAVPQRSSLGFMTVWPSGVAQPFTSTLNSPKGNVVANAAIVPAGGDGGIRVFVTDPSDVIIDVNGYFAAPGSPGALSFHALTPCRVADTRGISGPSLAPGQVRAFPISGAGCGTFPGAAAFSLNATVVPPGLLAYLTLFPDGAPLPYVSTLNSFDGAIVANAALVSASATGAIDAYVTNPTNLILDLNGYFAP